MAKINERAEMIGASILAQAEHEKKELVDKANAIRDGEIKAYLDRTVQDMFSKVQKQASDLRLESVKAVSAAQVQAQSAVLRRREELAGQVFADLRARLRDYAKTPAYKEAVLAELSSLAGAYDHAASVVYLREADMGAAAEIEKALPGCEVLSDTSINTGGWKLRNEKAGVLIDETLDARINGEKQWLLLNSNLKIV